MEEYKSSLNHGDDFLILIIGKRTKSYVITMEKRTKLDIIYMEKRTYVKKRYWNKDKWLD